MHTQIYKLHCIYLTFAILHELSQLIYMYISVYIVPKVALVTANIVFQIQTQSITHKATNITLKLDTFYSQ